MGNPFQSAATAVRQEANFEQGWGKHISSWGISLCIQDTQHEMDYANNLPIGSSHIRILQGVFFNMRALLYPL